MDLQQAFDAGFEAVKGYVDRSFQVFESRIEAIEKLVAGWPVPASIADIKAHVAEAVGALPVPRDGLDGPSADEVAAMVRSAVAIIPSPKDGESVTAEDVAPLIAEEVAKAVAALPVPRDGIGLASALIDRDGALVLTMTDGAMRNLGSVVGKDADMPLLVNLMMEEVAKIPPPHDGKDGFELEDFSVDYDGERTVTLKFVRGELSKESRLVLPVPIDRGIFSQGKNYERGDSVSWGGNSWIAQKATGVAPGENDDWRLALRKGRDGRTIVHVDPDPNKPVKL